MEQKLKQRICIEFYDPRQGRPTFQRTDENVQKITDLIKENHRTTLLELEQDTGISKTTIGRIVTEDLRLKKTPAKFIPRFLTNEQKLCRLATCKDMLEMTRTDLEWKDKIITGDETWVYGYDPETKRQSAEWRGQGEPRPKKSRILKSRNKVLLVAFLDNKGIVHHEYLPAGQTVIKEINLSILRRLREAIKKKRPEKWTNGDWILHHYNARPHTAHLVTSFLAKNRTEILPQPPYSPDIAPNDFFLFPKLKAVLKGRHFDTREDIIEKSLLALKSIPKEAYKNCFDNWEKRWRCERLGRPSVTATPSTINEVENLIFQPICLDFISSRQRMNSDLYCDILVNKLKPGIRNKRRGKLSKGVLFLHDNARPNTSCKTVSTIIKLGFEVLEHPAYSPDLASSDYFLFGLLKKELKGKRFDSDEDVQKVVQYYFHKLPKSAYKEGIYKLPERWRRCIESQGDYFE
ncbi:hypothetical protein LAZ67_7003388 [Cordylochernes scorpioides]|uniref:Transposase n=1 Tax=Cordylochernes scorpioides TaxID=51811 RepID=A0ABY6KNW9_9ARAC|nr:hypothetical protein LAZ67_7003388 [Cordylochernes scorpioides]